MKRADNRKYMNTIQGVVQPEPVQGEGPANIDETPPEEPANIKPTLPPRGGSRKLRAVIIGVAGVLIIVASFKFQDVKCFSNICFHTLSLLAALQ
jgi:hypothetical protein